MKNVNVKTLVIMGLCIALSFIGSFLKISGTIAFDALPGFLAAILLGPLFGGIVGFFGHLFTALSSGFPFSLPIHLVIAVTMFLSCYVFGFVYKKVNAFAGIIAGIIMNGPVSLAISALAINLIIAKGAGSAMLSGQVPFLMFAGLSLALVLTIGATINIVLAAIIYERTKDYIK